MIWYIIVALFFYTFGLGLILAHHIDKIEKKIKEHDKCIEIMNDTDRTLADIVNKLSMGYMQRE